MATTLSDSPASRAEATRQRERRTLRYLCVAFIATRRQRRARLRMLRAVRNLDHPGVLDDVRIACGPFRD
jgi:hypothetical protein